MSRSHKAPATAPTALGSHAAFDATAAARAALTPEELLVINLDIQVAITTVLALVPRLGALRTAIEANFKTFDLDEFDQIGPYAQALSVAHLRYLAASTPTESLPALVARATELRELLLSDASALAKRGIVDGKRLELLKGGPGYLNITTDLGILLEMLRERWTDIASKSAIQKAELDEAEAIYDRIIGTFGDRVQPSPSVEATSDDRQRAYTLFLRAYDQARRAATYLRWSEGDVDKVVPSLYAGRGGGRAGKSDMPAPNDGAPAGDAAAPAPAAHDGVPPAPAHAAPVAAGLPGGSPFTTN